MKRGFTLLELLVTIAAIAVVVLIERGIYDMGRFSGKKEIKSEAVKMEVARWTVTDDKGGTEFRWNSPKVPGNSIDPETGALAYMRTTNEFGVLEVRWTPPSKLVSTNGVDLGSPNYPWKNPILPPVPNDSYILRLKDSVTGKDIDVLIPVCTNPVVLNYSSTTIPLHGNKQ